MTSKSSSHTIVDEYDPILGYHPSVPPLDVRLGLTTPPSSATTASDAAPLRWGILGCSKVAHDFAQALKFLSSVRLPHSIAAVGSRSVERASDFARLHGVPNAHGSYEELCADPTVDVVYVASLHPRHREHAEMALMSGKHVLVEKPVTMTADDARRVYELAKRLNLFAGEGMWTRFFPAVEWARRRLGDATSAQGDAEDATIGTVRVVQADFSIDGTDVGPYPSDSLYASELGGGSAWCVAPYVVAAVLMPFDAGPNRIAAAGIVPEEDDGGGGGGATVGDLAVGMTLTFLNNDANTGSRAGGIPGHKSIASGVCGYLAESSETTAYAAKGGRIVVAAPAHCPTSATIVRKSDGRGNGTASGTTTRSDTDTVHFPLPPSTPEIEESGGIKLPNSMGFIYEAEALRRLVAAGQISFPQWTPEESVECIRIIEEVLRQVNQ